MMDEGTRTTRKPNSHDSVGAMTGHVTGMTVFVVSPASARSATTHWEIVGCGQRAGSNEETALSVGDRRIAVRNQNRQSQQWQHRVGVPGSGADQVRAE